uniref:Uncharacterized protein n=1 Tax=Anguilla anguilla TaxID=7936 RepID=A0A0E9VSU6_ANGAN
MISMTWLGSPSPRLTSLSATPSICGT